MDDLDGRRQPTSPDSPAGPTPARDTSGAAHALIGRTLNERYVLDAHIDNGGMGSVFKATDTRLRRTVAIKVMDAVKATDPEFAARFVREAHSAAALSHPNIVGVFDQGTDGEIAYLVMEYVEGTTLRKVISTDAPMGPGRALALLDPVIAGVAAAHAQRIVHRDIKPENVLIATDGRVKVADFGLARAVGTDTKHSVTGGVVMGTIHYLAPEVITNQANDARADVYALGCLLYELLTGAKTHPGEGSIQVAYAHVHEDVPAPSLLVPGLPAYVDALVARATVRDTDRRPPDARVLQQLVRRVAQALSMGVNDDPSLVADLLPPSGSRDDAPVATDELDPATVAVAAPVVTPDDGGVVPPSWLNTTPVPRPESRTPAPPAAPPMNIAPPPGGYPRRSRRGPVMVVASVLALVLVVLGTLWLTTWRYTDTPSLIGLTVPQAEQKAAQSGLQVEISEQRFSETVKAGLILETDPAPGDKVRDGGTIHVVISKGKERYDVPPLKGMTEDEAQDALADSHLTFQRSVSRYSETVDEGLVIRTNPPVGTRVRPDTPVTLVLSKGPKPIDIPDFSGRSLAEAEPALRDLGFKVTTTEEFSDSVQAGYIISQTPNSGTGFKKDVIELTVSKGPEFLTIPDDIVGSPVDQAQAELEGLGLKVKVRKIDNYLGFDAVFSCDPGEGSTVRNGSTVYLYKI